MHHMENGSKHFNKYNPGVFQNAKVNGGMSLPFTPLSISFENIQYFVDMPKVRFHTLVKHNKTSFKGMQSGLSKALANNRTWLL